MQTDTRKKIFRQGFVLTKKKQSLLALFLILTLSLSAMAQSETGSASLEGTITPRFSYHGPNLHFDQTRQ